MANQEHNSQSWLQHAALTDVGMRRINNQDSYTVLLAGDPDAWSERGHIFMVADGMGAHAAGELASKLAVDGVPHHYHKYRTLSPPEALHKAIQETNAEIHRRGRANIDFHNMGTTCSVLVLLPQGALVAHVGDSRVYRLHGDRLDQLTFDHSLLWELRAAGQLPEGSGNGERAIPKNVITRSLGPNATVQVDVEGPFAAEVGDTFLVCSDGLTGQVADEELGPILANLPVDEAARVLVDLANLRGGPDNSTVLVVRIADTPTAGTRTRVRPFTIGGSRLARQVHPILWVVVGVCLVAAFGMALAERYIAALVAVGGALVSLAVALYQKLIDASRSVALGRGQRLGRGPYQQVTCRANGRVVKTLADIAEELKQAATDHEWAVDFEHFNELRRKADEAVARKQHVQALRLYAAAISFLMQELRSQRQRKARDSAIDY